LRTGPRAHFARESPQHASYNRIIAAAGISKTAAYHYFDGRDDLLGTVLEDVEAQLIASLGRWVPAEDGRSFWERLAERTARVKEHLAANPDDLALAPAALERTDGAGLSLWLTDVMDNGRKLGVVRSDVDPDLLLAATTAVFRISDAWPPEQVRLLLAGLWSTPEKPAR
ncbi:TetR/AcrR family transcriptional regulator, partial [Allokutzneria sp. NRRL B-24872]|uniref:TetR/AcrR family transcriptional regulator n=1 Tax=Allokutzneria sp. NRRL B-24872 TaxID=1137961 RepID=UPI00143D087D